MNLEAIDGSQTRGRDPLKGRQKTEKGRQLLKKEEFLEIFDETCQK
jgi:hypothetical protein